MDYKLHQKAIKGLVQTGRFVADSGLPLSLIHLIEVRASQINGCAFCIDMHAKEARAAGETEQRLYALANWKETPFYTDKERAALKWTEALTLIAGNDISDELYEEVSSYFDEEELLSLTMAVITINGWNRLAKPFRSIPGSYQLKS